MIRLIVDFDATSCVILELCLILIKIADLDRYSNHVNKENFFSYSGRTAEINQNSVLSHFTVYMTNPIVAQRIHRQHSNNSILYEIDLDQAIVSDIILARKGYAIALGDYVTDPRIILFEVKFNKLFLDEPSVCYIQYK